MHELLTSIVAKAWRCLQRPLAAHGLTAVLSLGSVVLAPRAAADATTEFVYEGRLTNQGAPVTGPVSLRLNFFHSTSPGVAPVVSVTEGLESTPLAEGVFQVRLNLTNTDYAKIFSGVTQAVYVEVTDLTHAANAPYPRQKLSTVPYAARVPVDGQTIAFDANGNLAVGPSGSPGANQFLTKDGNGNFVWATPSAASTLIEGQSVSATTPTSGQVLLFNGSQWQSAALPATAATGVAALSATAPLTVGGTSSNPALSVTQATSVSDGYVTAGDWLNFSGKVSKSGDSMSGALDMGSAAIHHVAAPTAGSDAATKAYTDSAVASSLAASGSTPLTGNWAVGGKDITGVGNLTISAAKTLGLGVFDGSTEPALIAALTAADKGKAWFNTSTNQIKYWDGSTAVVVGASGSGLSNLNGQTGNTQTFGVPGTSGTAPTWSSASNTHTLNIPLAATSGVTAGLLANADYAAFAAKVGSVAAGAGLATTSAGGTVTVGLANTGTSGTYTKITTNAQGQVTSGGSLSAADIPALSASAITSGTLAVSVGGTGVTTFANHALLVGAGNSPVGTVVNGNQYNVLTTDVSGAPVFGQVALDQANAVSGSLGVGNGGTGLSALGADNQLLGVANAGGALEYKSLVGTSNQIAIATSAGTVVLSTPQAIATSSSPTFATVNLTGSLGLGNSNPTSLLDLAGALTERGLATPPATSSSGQGVLYFDSTSHHFMASENGGAYQQLALGVTATTVSAGAGLQGGTFATNGTISLPTLGSVGTFAKVITDAYGRVAGSTSLVAGDIPALAASAIASGTFAVAQIPNLPASILTTGTLALATVPSLPAGTITSGTLALATVPSLPAGTITSGTLALATVPSLPAATITSGTLALATIPVLPFSALSGTLALASIPSLPATAITSGTLALATVPSLPATAITSGTLSAALLPPLPTAMITSGTLPVASGGTGLAASPGAGQLLIGNGSAYALANLTSGPNASITIANGAGSITLDTAQDIRASAAPNFSGLALNSLTGRGVAAPSVSATNQGIIYFDSATAQFKVSQNGSSYAPLATGGSVTSVTAGAGLVSTTFATAGTISLPTLGVAGSYAKVVTDAYGRVTGSTSLLVADLPPISATSLTTGTLAVANGGTGVTSFTNNGVVIGSGTALSSTALGAQYNVLTAGSGGVPAFGQVNLASTAAVSGALPVGNGGTGLTAGTSGGVPYYSSAATLASSAVLTAGGVVLGGGAGAAPTATTLGSGQLLIGTTGAPTAASLTATGNNGVVIASSAGAIALSTAQDIRASATPTFAGLTLTGTQTLGSGTVQAAVYLAGTGDGGASPVKGSVRAANATGANLPGAGLTITAGDGTGTGGSGAISFQTAAAGVAGSTPDTLATVLTIAPTGNVGIGTTAPSLGLEVNGDVRLGDNLSNYAAGSANWGNALVFSGGVSMTPGFDSDNTDPLWMARYNAGNDITELRMIIGDNTSSVGPDKFAVGPCVGGSAEYSQSCTWTPRFTVQSDGNVGVGTSAPGSIFQVGSSASAGSDYLTIDAAAAQQSAIEFNSAGSYAWIRATDLASGGSPPPGATAAERPVSSYYVAADGTSLQRQFLHSPLYRARVTSGFTRRRFHPILKVNRPHYGVDYGAPMGTPVMAAADGVVAFAGVQGGSGKMITLRHGERYQTKYKHLAHYASDLAVGQTVRMGQIIGYVGATGLATGPHLHYEFYQDAHVVDPQTVHFPPMAAIPPQQLPAFRRRAREILSQLPGWTHGDAVAALVN